MSLCPSIARMRWPMARRPSRSSSSLTDALSVISSQPDQDCVSFDAALEDRDRVYARWAHRRAGTDVEAPAVQGTEQLEALEIAVGQPRERVAADVVDREHGVIDAA